MDGLIYYIEDEEDIAWGVREYLQNKGFHVEVLGTAREAKAALERKLPSLALVDWNLPDGSGEQLCRWVRERWKELPVIFLTVRGESGDIVRGFENGADDYISKPFDLAVLHARIRALLKRAGKGETARLSCGPLSLDTGTMKVYWEARSLPVSPVEYRLLEILIKNQHRTVTRQSLLESIWDSSGNYVNDNTLTVAMKRLREKLPQPECIRTIRSFGYCMEEVET